MLTSAGSDIILNSVILLDPSFFSTVRFENVLSAFSDSVTVLSVQPDVITGSVARRSYFPNNTDIFFFQLVHITRVKVLIGTKNNTFTAGRLYSSLGPACLNAGVGFVAIDSNTAATSSNVVLDWISNIPPSAMIIIIVGWVLTASSCAFCWLLYCCCKSRRDTVPVAVIEAPSAPVFHTAVPQEDNTAVSFNQTRFSSVMRLPAEMTQRQSSGQYGQYAAQTSFEGPSAMHLGSWHSGPASARL